MFLSWLASSMWAPGQGPLQGVWLQRDLLFLTYLVITIHLDLMFLSSFTSTVWAPGQGPLQGVWLQRDLLFLSSLVITIHLNVMFLSWLAARCEPLDKDLCKVFGFNVTHLPNLWLANSQEQALNMYYAYGEKSVSLGCHGDALFYLCSVIFPQCDSRGNLQLSCRDVCHSKNFNL